MTDDEIVLQAVHEVRVILGIYTEPGPRDCERALNSILGVMGHGELIAATERLDRRNALQLVSLVPSKFPPTASRPPITQPL